MPLSRSMLYRQNPSHLADLWHEKEAWGLDLSRLIDLQNPLINGRHTSDDASGFYYQLSHWSLDDIFSEQAAFNSYAHMNTAHLPGGIKPDLCQHIMAEKIVQSFIDNGICLSRPPQCQIIDHNLLSLALTYQHIRATLLAGGSQRDATADLRERFADFNADFSCDLAGAWQQGDDVGQD